MEKIITPEININISLKKGDRVNIFTDWQDENNFEGEAILLKRTRVGDSYYLDREAIKPEDSKEYSSVDKEAITKYNRLNNFFKGSENKKPSVYCRRLYRDLIKVRKDELTDFIKMKKILVKYRKNHTKSIKRIGSLLNEYEDYYIIRFVQQDRTTWRPSIFIHERWTVQMISDSTGWPQDWVTSRNIRLLKCYNPSESLRNSELVQYTTYSGMSSRTFERLVHKDKYLVKMREEQQKEHESVFIDDDEMDDLIESKMKK